MIEKEYKSLINEEIYNKLINNNKIDKTYKQTNYYYCDKKGILRDKHITIRVRERDGKYKLQAKYQEVEQKDLALAIRTEKELEIEKVPSIIKSDIIKKFINIEVEDAIFMGKLTTIRNEIKKNDDVLICIDKSIYLDEVDFEVEVEFEKDMDRGILEELEKLGVEFNKKIIGKCTRCLKQVTLK